MSWIHETDLNNIFAQAIIDATMSGVYIVSSPNPVSQVDFMRTLRKVIGMPIGLPAFEWMVRIGAPLVLRTDPELALNSLDGLKSKGTAPTGQAPTARELAVVDSKGTSAPTAPLASITEPKKLEDPESVAGVASSARSGCAAYHESIVAGLKQQLTAQRIYQDLVTDHGFSGSYRPLLEGWRDV